MLLSDRDPFTIKSWQEFLNQFGFLADHGLTINDVREALEAKRREQAEQIKNSMAAVARTLKKCPQCLHPMQILPINDTPATQTGDDSKCVWLCRQCGEAIYSTKTIEEELKSCQVD